MNSLKHKLKSPKVKMGDISLRQPIPQNEISQIGPFLLLHHAGPFQVKPGENPMDIGPHPHRGFDPVTFVFQGAVLHRDSLGNKCTIESGGVQWIRAGRGIIHAEGPDPEFIDTGGILEIIQLWINAPAKRKMEAPQYFPVPKDKLPKLIENAGEIHLVSGEWNGTTGPVPTPENVLSAMAYFKKGTCWRWKSTNTQERIIYLLDGEVWVDDQICNGPMLLHLNQYEFNMRITADTRALILSGNELNEPVATYGPFVMNNQQEIIQALKDYQSGKMGSLEV